MLTRSQCAVTLKLSYVEGPGATGLNYGGCVAEGEEVQGSLVFVNFACGKG